MNELLDKKAPDFTLPDQDNNTHSLSDYAGKWLILYFYPKDDTPGCTKEACSFRDNYTQYKKAGIEIIGVSADSVEKHKKFADKHKLPFTLLADEEKTVVNDYGVWGQKKFMGKEYMGISRASFLIDPQGIIKKVYPKVKPEDHAEEVLNDVEKLKNS